MTEPTDEQRAPRRRWVPLLVVAGVVAVLLTVVVVVALLGSGDDEAEPAGDTTTTTEAAPALRPADQWRSTTQEGCERWNEEFGHLRDAEPGTAEEAVQHTAEVQALAEGLAATVAEAGLPEGDERDDARRLTTLLARMAEAANELAAATVDRDGPRVEDATNRIEALGADVNALAEELEVPACGGY